MYAEFTAALETRNAIGPKFRILFQGLQSKYEAAILDADRAVFPKRTKAAKWLDWRAAIARMGEAADAFTKPWKDRTSLLVRAQIDAEEAAETELRRIAEKMPLPPGDTLRPRMYAEVHSHSYSSQGYGAMNYAKSLAEMYADKARYYGLGAEVHELESHYVRGPAGFGGGITHGSYGVFIDTTPLGWEILRRKPAIELRAVIMQCWKRGINPRVIYPFLPHGYEEANGLDYFGNDLKATA